MAQSWFIFAKLTFAFLIYLSFRIDKTKAICLIVHACDISHASKPWKLHKRWTEGVLEEFFRQGDLEASMGLPYSPLCDRHTVHVADSQIGEFYIWRNILVWNYNQKFNENCYFRFHRFYRWTNNGYMWRDVNENGWTISFTPTIFNGCK